MAVNELVMWTRAQVAEACGVSETTIIRWRRSGRLPRPIRLGKLARWSADEIRAWAARESAAANGAEVSRGPRTPAVAV